MFYSQTFLARKGPLGTVWCAAHLQHRLKKSHYTSTDINSTVDRIMFPEVPIALRMSGHLLLGVVRIYSKKVDYLFQDCNVVLTGLSKAFASIQLTLPEDARQAPFQSITRPDTFNLDLQDLDDDIHFEGVEDTHLRTQEEITLTDQIPNETEPYFAVVFEEDSNMETSQLESEPIRMAEDMPIIDDDPSFSNQTEVPKPGPDEENPPPKDPSSSNQTQAPKEGPDTGNSPPAIEILRQSIADVNFPPVFPDESNNCTEPNRSLDQTMNVNEIQSMIDDSPYGPSSIPFQQGSGPPTSAASQEPPENFEHNSPHLELQSTPHVEQPRMRGRKRKQFFDESTVLRNKFIKKGLQDPNDLLRMRKSVPISALSAWKLNNSLRKEQVFDQPSLTGMCTDLCNIFKKDNICKNQTQVEPIARAPSLTATVLADVEEIEHLRNIEDNERNFFPEVVSSPGRRDNSPHASPEVRTNDVTTLPSTPDLMQSPGPLASVMETPMTFVVDKSGLSETLELIDSPYQEDLYFLEADNNTPTRSQGSEGVNSLSVRTRAVAQYLKRHSPISPIPEDLSGDLSLKKILEGKTRKLCARMFFETLVLKSYGLIDVEQEEPYSDISLKLTSTLSKAQF
ncbi:Sister chromatid cohesion 1 protein 3 [Quillaja saponaria]|uniref:Sister chromatid cohesion 1 protein 3 n=1 Tax=Quillaja saponaria TaxID=32244 RepID=A0AAD7L0D1_QUISA|nr:Sister chromatid cohesion 1 protein 3 [Quillaja saponaria]